MAIKVDSIEVGGGRRRGRCAGLEVEFTIVGANGTRQASECVLVEEALPYRPRLRHRAGR